MNSRLEKALLKRFSGDVERVGFVLQTGKVVEVENICANPVEGFDVSGEDLVKYSSIAKATWHTHPGSDNNLSVSDYRSFLNWPKLEHYIIGTNGVRCYIVENDEVLVG